MEFTKLIYDEHYWNDKKWFEFCQECLKNKFIDKGYQCLGYEESLELGYSGFNENGNVFITICENRANKRCNKDIIEKLESRINNIANMNTTTGLLSGEFPIDYITIITPENLQLDIKMHLKDFESNLKNIKSDVVGEKFKIKFWDIGYFLDQIPIILKSKKFFYDFKRGKITENEINEFSKVNTMYMDNLHRKLQKLLLENDMVDELENTENAYVLDYLQGKYIIDDLAENVEYLYSELMSLIGDNEDTIRRKSMRKQEDKITYLDDVTNELKKRLFEEYSDIFHKNDIYEINNYVISDWLMRCPLNFR